MGTLNNKELQKSLSQGSADTVRCVDVRASVAGPSLLKYNTKQLPRVAN